VVTCRDGAAHVDTVGASRGDLNPELSVLLSTSGSTGSPKAVRFTNARLAANALSIAEYLGLDDSEIALAHLPLQYSFGMSVVNSHLAAGAQLLLTTRSMMEAQFWAMAERATSFSGVPFHYEMLERLRFERRQMPVLRTLTQAGGRMPPERVRRFAELAAKRGWRLFVMYGQTEAGPRIAYLPPEDAVEHAGVIGKAIPGMTIELRRAGRRHRRGRRAGRGRAVDHARIRGIARRPFAR
jgi:acyl-CoA synthetase (AMP-forming)/AMP-acid ligase II